MSEDEIKIEKPCAMVDTVEKILDLLIDKSKKDKH